MLMETFTDYRNNMPQNYIDKKIIVRVRNMFPQLDKYLISNYDVIVMHANQTNFSPTSFSTTPVRKSTKRRKKKKKETFSPEP